MIVVSYQSRSRERARHRIGRGHATAKIRHTVSPHFLTRRESVKSVGHLAYATSDTVTFHKGNQSKGKHVLDKRSHRMAESGNTENIESRCNLTNNFQILQVIMFAIIAGLQQVSDVTRRNNGKQRENRGEEVVNAVPHFLLGLRTRFEVPFEELRKEQRDIQGHTNLI